MQDNRTPVSWALLFIALFHFIIYSVGVQAEPAKDFLVREAKNLQEKGVQFHGPNHLKQEQELYLLEKLTVKELQTESTPKQPEPKPESSFRAQAAQRIFVFVPNIEESQSDESENDVRA